MSAAAAILAGGRARRYGGRIKAHLIVEGRRILDRQLEVLRLLFSDIALCANDPAPYADTGLPVLPDATAGCGPLAGIASALAWTPRPRVFVVACDMPFLEAAAIELLLARAGELVVPVVGGRPEPLHAVYHRDLLARVQARLSAGRRRAAGLIDDARATLVDEPTLRAVDPELRFLVNLNEPPPA